MRIASFNVQNLRLRRVRGQPRFDGARDGDVARDRGRAAAALDLADRRLTAAVLAAADADVVILQEVFDQTTLDAFHDLLLAPRARAPWPWRRSYRGNDGGGRHLALICRTPPLAVVSHAKLRAADLGLPDLPGPVPERPVFCRDVLRIEFPALTILACHFKAGGPGDRRAAAQRRGEARALAALIARDCPPGRMWLVLGDLNTHPARLPALSGLGVDLLTRLPRPQRWTWAGPEGQIGRPDWLLAAPALAARWPQAVPQLLRQGLGLEVTRHRGPRLPGVGRHRPRASDHVCLMLDLPGL